jgi:hypothetical protein
MKHIVKFLILALAVALFSGCNPHEQDLFGDSSANRMTAVLKADKDILCAPKNGWRMEYYPSKDQQYGGYNVWVSFSVNGSVSAMSERYGTGTTVTSLFSLKQSGGPILTFDSYNKVIHYYSDPANPDGIGKNGQGMGGDFEFTILSAKTDTIILKGKKSGSKIVMTPVADNSTGTDYIASVIAANKLMTFSSYKYEVNGKSIPVTISYRNLTFTYQKAGNAVSVSAPFLVTPTGYKLYSPLTIEGVTVSELTYKYSATEDFFVPNNGAAAKLVVVFPPLNQQLISGNWYFTYSGLGSYGKTQWNSTKTNGFDAIGEELYYAYLGKFSGGQYGFSFGSTDGASVYTGVLVFPYTLIGLDQVKFVFASTVGAGNGVWYYDNANFSTLISPIASSATGNTFTLTSDNAKTPTWIKLTDNANANNTITLSKTTVYWPYDK